MDFAQIQQLIELVDKTNISELKIKTDAIKISIRTKHYTEALKESKNASSTPAFNFPFQQTAPAPIAPVHTIASAPSVSPSPKTSDASTDSSTTTPAANQIIINSPMIGTFYRASGPDKEPYIKLGDTIKVGDPLCIVEAMKLFNEIEAEVSGRIVEILIEDAQPVQYDQPLFVVEPV